MWSLMSISSSAALRAAMIRGGRWPRLNTPPALRQAIKDGTPSWCQRRTAPGAPTAADAASPILCLGGARRRNDRMGVRISDVESVRLLDEGVACPETTSKQIAARALRGGGGRRAAPA